MDNFVRFLDAVNRRLESLVRASFRIGANAVGYLCERGRLLMRTRSLECIWGLVRTRLASHSNPFGFSFEPVLASRSNEFGFLFERISYNDQTRPGYGANTFIRGANALGQKMCYTLCLTGTVYDVSASIKLIISSFSSIVNTTLLLLNFSVILLTLLKSYSINNVTTAHAQSSQGCVQIIKGSYNRVFR